MADNELDVRQVVTAIGWVGATPFTYRHPRVVQRVGYALIGPLQRLFEYTNSKPGAFTEKDISPYLWHNGTYPEEERMESGQQVVSATVPGQIFSRQILSFIRTPDTREIHRNKGHLGFRVFTTKAMQMAEASVRPWSRLGNGSQVTDGGHLGAEKLAAQPSPTEPQG